MVFLPTVLATVQAHEPVVLHGGDLRAAISPLGAALQSVATAGPTGNLLLTPDAARPYKAHGHFLCFDRWGRISDAEKTRGYRFHGEAWHQRWRVISAAANRATLRTTLPASQLTMERTYLVSTDVPVLTITSVAINHTGLPRPYNLVEHVAPAPMWLDPDVRLYANASAGHLHRAGMPVPDSAFTWPRAHLSGQEIDLRGVFHSEQDVIASVIFPPDDSHGWTLLHDTKTNTAFAMVWPRHEYPWLNLWWRGAHASKAARAIEPGTTGLHRPIEECIERGTLLGNPLFIELPPGESRRHRLHYVLLPPLPERAEFADAAVTAGVFQVRWRTAQGWDEQNIPLPAAD